MVPSLRRTGAVAGGLVLAFALPGLSMSAWAQPGNGNGNGNGAANGQGNGGGNAPPGNNGHVQIDEYSMDGGNGNDPHVGCGFSVSFFGYDGGPQSATITVTPWAPTSGGRPTTFGPVTWNVGARTSGNQFDANSQISEAMLAPVFAGVTPAAQGYHARIEVEVTGSQGSDDKYKMVWIAPCTSPKPAAPSSSAPAAPSSSAPVTGVSPTPVTSSPQPVGAAPVAGAGGTTVPGDTAGATATELAAIADTPPLAALAFKAASAPVTRGHLATLTSGLAFTGAEIAAMVLAALVAIGTGALLLAARRGWSWWA